MKWLVLCFPVVVVAAKSKLNDNGAAALVAPSPKRVVIDSAASLEKYNFKGSESCLGRVVSECPDCPKDNRLHAVRDGDDETFDGGQVVMLQGRNFDNLEFGGSKDVLCFRHLHSIADYIAEHNELSANIYNGGQTVLVRGTTVRVLDVGSYGDIYNGGLKIAVKDSDVFLLNVGAVRDMFYGGQAISVHNSKLLGLNVGFTECEFFGGLSIGIDSEVFGSMFLTGNFNDGQQIVVDGGVAETLSFGGDGNVFKGGITVDVKSEKFSSMSFDGSYHDGQSITVTSNTFDNIRIGSGESVFKGGLTLAVNSTRFNGISFGIRHLEGDLAIFMDGAQLGPVSFENTAPFEGRLVFVVTNHPTFLFDDSMRNNVDTLFGDYFDKNLIYLEKSGEQVMILNGHKFVRNHTTSSYSGHVHKTFPHEVRTTAETILLIVTNEVASVVKEQAGERGLEMTVDGNRIKSFAVKGNRNIYNGHQTLIAANKELMNSSALTECLASDFDVELRALSIFAPPPAEDGMTKFMGNFFLGLVAKLLIVFACTLLCCCYKSFRRPKTTEQQS